MGAIETFLSKEEVKKLTGCSLKALQIDTLRKNGVRFTLNRQGKPIVPRSAIDGSEASKKSEAKPAWSPRILKAS